MCSAGSCLDPSDAETTSELLHIVFLLVFLGYSAWIQRSHHPHQGICSWGFLLHLFHHGLQEVTASSTKLLLLLVRGNIYPQQLPLSGKSHTEAENDTNTHARLPRESISHTNHLPPCSSRQKIFNREECAGE